LIKNGLQRCIFWKKKNELFVGDSRISRNMKWTYFRNCILTGKAEVGNSQCNLNYYCLKQGSITPRDSFSQAKTKWCAFISCSKLHAEVMQNTIY
jgi:hypothetical protein